MPILNPMNTDAVSTTACPTCGSDQLLTVTFEIDGSMVLFRTCPPCESKWWEHDGVAIDRDVAIPLVTAA